MPIIGLDHVQLAMPPGREGEAPKLTALGVDVVPDGQIEDTVREYVDDPFGNRIELIEESLPS